MLVDILIMLHSDQLEKQLINPDSALGSTESLSANSTRRWGCVEKGARVWLYSTILFKLGWRNSTLKHPLLEYSWQMLHLMLFIKVNGWFSKLWLLFLILVQSSPFSWRTSLNSAWVIGWGIWRGFGGSYLFTSKELAEVVKASDHAAFVWSSFGHIQLGGDAKVNPVWRDLTKI